MGIPDRLDAWDYDTVVEIVKTHEFEPALFDYKDVLNARDDEIRESIRRTVCSMANTDGGFILFGIQDRKHNVSNFEDRIQGISLEDDLLKQFNDKIDVIQPEVHFETPPGVFRLPHNPKRGIFVVKIPRSQRRPHMVESSNIFYSRGQGGKAVPMRFTEVREQMLNTEERQRKVTMLRLLIAQYRNQVKKLSPYLPSDPAGTVQVYFDTTAFTTILADICSLIPSSTHFLQDLLEIPVHANMTRDALQLHPILGPAQGRGATLDQLCYGCEVQLEKQFGPLGIENRPPA